MITRGLAAFLGGFTLLNIAGNILAPGFDSNQWWLDLRPLPSAVASVLLVPPALLLIAAAVQPVQSLWRTRITFVAVTFLALIALANAVTFYVLLLRHQLYSAIPVPLSASICVALIAVGAGLYWPLKRPARLGERWVGAATIAACLVGFPLAQTWFFGHTDYRRPADAIVVFGIAPTRTAGPQACSPIESAPDANSIDRALRPC